MTASSTERRKKAKKRKRRTWERWARIGKHGGLVNVGQRAVCTAWRGEELVRVRITEIFRGDRRQ